MRTSRAGVELIKSFEGCRLEPYYDAAGYPTIGYGHLLSRKKWSSLETWSPLTEQEAEDLLRSDLPRYEAAVRRLIRVPLSRGQFDALVSFCFNLGAGTLQASTLRRVLNQGAYGEAPAQIQRWVYAGGQRLRGLVRRRLAEVMLGAEWIEPWDSEEAA